MTLIIETVRLDKHIAFGFFQVFDNRFGASTFRRKAHLKIRCVKRGDP
jgi:hypothetical protein